MDSVFPFSRQLPMASAWDYLVLPQQPDRQVFLPTVSNLCHALPGDAARRTDLFIRLISSCQQNFHVPLVRRECRLPAALSFFRSAFRLCFFLLRVNNAAMRAFVATEMAHDGSGRCGCRNNFRIVSHVI